jgi:hypothetical protein
MENQNELLNFLNSMKIDSSVSTLQESLGYSKSLVEGDYIFELNGCKPFSTKYTDPTTQIENVKNSIKYTATIKSLPKTEVNDITGDIMIIDKGGSVLDDDYSLSLGYFATNPHIQSVKRFASLVIYSLEDSNVSFDSDRMTQLYSVLESPDKIITGDIKIYGKNVTDQQLFLADKLDGLSTILNKVIQKNIEDCKNPMFKLSIVSWEKNGKKGLNKKISLFSDETNKNLL